MAELTFYTNPQSRGAIVRWMLEELAEPYETVVLDYGPPMKTAEYRALNPMGKVPAIRHGDQVVTEAAAICAYLGDAFPQAGLAPPPGRRAAYYRWLFFGAGPVEAAVTNRTLGVEVPPERRGMVGYGDFDTMLEALHHAVSAAPWLAGDDFSAADVYTGSQIGWGLQFGTLPDTPPLRAYWDRASARPAWLRATMKDKALIPAAG